MVAQIKKADGLACVAHLLRHGQPVVPRAIQEWLKINQRDRVHGG